MSPDFSLDPAAPAPRHAPHGLLPPDDPQRASLHNEVHSRPLGKDPRAGADRPGGRAQ
jgi:hypothetical protein